VVWCTVIAPCCERGNHLSSVAPGEPRGAAVDGGGAAAALAPAHDRVSDGDAFSTAHGPHGATNDPSVALTWTLLRTSSLHGTADASHCEVISQAEYAAKARHAKVGRGRARPMLVRWLRPSARESLPALTPEGGPHPPPPPWQEEDLQICDRSCAALPP
jgi:hypothetical protein